MKYRERYNREGLYEAAIYDGIPEMLKTLHNAGIKLVLATSKPLVFAEKIMKHFNFNIFGLWMVPGLTSNTVVFVNTHEEKGRP